MKIRSTNILATAGLFILFVVVPAIGQGGSDYVITKDSVGGIRLGMTIAEAKRVYQDAEFNNNGEDGQINVSRSGKLVMMVVPDTADVTSSSRITGITVIDSRYKTASGIFPGITIVAAEKIMGKIGRMTLSYGVTETADFVNQPTWLRFVFKGKTSSTAGIYDVKYPDPREQFATKFNSGAYIYSIQLVPPDPSEEAQAQNFTRDLTGTGWTYNYGGTTYQFDFGQTRIEKFSNGWWQGVTWTPIGDNQIRLKNSETGKEMTLIFDSANSYSGIDWDGKTKVSGTRRNAASPGPANFTITKTSAGNIRLAMTIAEARAAMKGATFERTSDGEGVALISVKQGDIQLMTLYADEADPQRPIDETARIMNIEVWDQRFKTAAGIHPNMKLVDVEKILGKVKTIIRSEIESREYADFKATTDGFIYRLMGPDSNAGIYPAGTRETTRYVANTYIYTISIAQERSPDAADH